MASLAHLGVSKEVSRQSVGTNRQNSHALGGHRHPNQNSMRTLLCPVFLLICLPASTPALLCAAELFPFQPPSTSSPRGSSEASAPEPQLSKDDLARIANIVSRANGLKPDEQKEFRKSILQSLDAASKQDRLSQVRYYKELLRQLP